MPLSEWWDWSANRADWPELLARFKHSGGRALEIGAFEGRTTLWLAEWLYHDPLNPGHVVAVDPLTGEGQWPALLDSDDMRTAGAHLFENTADLRAAGRCTLVIGHSERVLPMLAPGFDIIYVDGDHTREGVAGDARLAGRLVKHGGVLIFDDYGAADYPGVREAADEWLAAQPATFRLVHAAYQLVVQRC